MPRTRDEYERGVATLVGRRITGVSYYELDYGNQAFFTTYPHIGHLLDFGCDLRLDDGTVRGIIWDGEYAQYGVSMIDGSLSAHLLHFRAWEMSRDDNWARLIGHAVTAARVYWAPATIGAPEAEPCRYPQDLELCFAGGDAVYLSASSYRGEPGGLDPMSDDIAVIFGRDRAEHLGIGPYAAAP